MFCENLDCDNELSVHQIADGECFCSSECAEESLRLNDRDDDFLHLWDDPYEVDDGEDDEE